MAKQIAYFPAAYSDIACRDIGVGTDMAEELAHETLAEAHDLGIRFASRIEIGSSLCSAHRKRCKGVFESLLESKEFHDGEIHARMETDTSLIWTDCR